MIFFFETGLRISVLAGAGLGVCWMMRGQSAAVRHCILAASILSAVTLPFAALFVPSWQPLPQLAADDLKPFEVIVTPILQSESSPEGKAHVTRGSAASVLILPIGFVFLLIGLLQVEWIASHSEPAQGEWVEIAQEISRKYGLRKRVQLLQSKHPRLLATWGFPNSALILPSGADKWERERIRVVLSHEFAHIRRYDWPIQMIAELLCAIYWFNPLLWVVRNRLRKESELACDDSALILGIEPSEYAQHLLELARLLKNPNRAWWPVLPMAEPSALERRFTSMLNPDTNRRPRTRAIILLTALIFISVSIAVAALSIKSSAKALEQMPSGRFHGTVSDSSGAAMPQVTLIMSNPRSRTKDITMSHASGEFEFAGLPAGEYVLQAFIPGFSRRQYDVVLQPGQDHVQNVTLDVGNLEESVVVRAPRRVEPAVIQSPAKVPARIRVGGNVQVSRMISNVKPEYPPSLRDAGIEGSVLLEAVIGIDGSVTEMRLLNSRVEPAFASAATEAVRQWKYRPTLLNGAPVQVICNITVKFQLAQ